MRCHFTVILTVCLGLLATHCATAFKCNLPTFTSRVVDFHEASGDVALVRENCPELHDRPSTSWRKGVQLKVTSCRSITPLTALATFEGSKGTAYNGGEFQNSVIFIGRCNSHGFYVVDQDFNKDRESAVSGRILKYSASGVDGGSNYYVIQ